MKNFLQELQKLTKTQKSMIGLMQIYFMGQLFGGTFLNMYFYKYLDGVLGLFQANALIYLLSTLAFCTGGYLFAKIQKSIKNGFYIAFLTYILSFLFIQYIENTVFIFVYCIIYGIANGFYWSTYHQCQLTLIDDKSRDFFTSNVTIGKTILQIILPLLISFAFILSGYFENFSGYEIVFACFPFLYAGSLFFLKNIPDIIPKIFSPKDIFTNFHPHEIYQNLFFFFGTQAITLPRITLIICMIYVLKTEVNLGLFQAGLGLVSIIITGFFATKRKSQNRIKMLWMFGGLNALNYLFLGYDLNLLMLTLFSLFSLLFTPQYEITQHVLILKHMSDIKGENKNFLPKMIYREIIILVSRLSFLVFFGILYSLFPDHHQVILEIMIYYTALVFLLSALFATLAEKRLKSIEIS